MIDISEFGGGVEIAREIGGFRSHHEQDDFSERLHNVTAPSGIRNSSQEITRRCLKEIDMKNIVYFFRRVLVVTVDPTSVVEDTGAFGKEYSFDE